MTFSIAQIERNVKECCEFLQKFFENRITAAKMKGGEEVRKKELLEELKTAHNWTDHWASLVNGLIGENQKLLKQNGDLRVENATLRERVENATLRERLRKNPPEDQEDLTAD